MLFCVLSFEQARGRLFVGYVSLKPVRRQGRFILLQTNEDGVGKHNFNSTFIVLGSELAVTTQETELGIRLDSSLKKIFFFLNRLCTVVTKNANKQGILKKRTENTMENFIVKINMGLELLPNQGGDQKG